jgi:hypothetical protein
MPHSENPGHVEHKSPVSPNLAFALHYLFKSIPLLIGGMSIFLGYRLFILGVTGQASLSVTGKGVGFQLLNAAPGLFFALGGIALVWRAIGKGAGISATPGKHGTKFFANIRVEPPGSPQQKAESDKKGEDSR